MSFKRILIAIILLISFSLLLCSCGWSDTHENFGSSNTLYLYAEEQTEYVQALLDEYNKTNKQTTIKLVSKEEYSKTFYADIYLLENTKIMKLDDAKALGAYPTQVCDFADNAFYNEAGTWYTVFYDPVVLLVNHQYARLIGQENLRTWEDLLHFNNIKIGLENLSDSQSTTNFLCCMASHFGENNALNYLKELHKYVPQYAKFAFSPIRTTAIGETHLTITRKSHIYQYLENTFPAYIFKPNEGIPVNLYCIGINKNIKNLKPATEFRDWLLTNQTVKQLSLDYNTGLEFLQSDTTDFDKLWLNSHYLSENAQTVLVDKWLRTVRFEDNLIQ